MISISRALIRENTVNTWHKQTERNKKQNTEKKINRKEKNQEQSEYIPGIQQETADDDAQRDFHFQRNSKKCRRKRIFEKLKSKKKDKVLSIPRTVFGVRMSLLILGLLIIKSEKKETESDLVKLLIK